MCRVTLSSVERNSTNSARPPSNLYDVSRMPVSGSSAKRSIAHDDLQAGYEERRLTGAADELVVLEGRVLREDLAVGPVPHAGAGTPRGALPAIRSSLAVSNGG